MRVKLKGIARATAKLADGTQKTYYYAWRGGPKLDGAPGTPEFLLAYQAAHAARRTPPQGVLFTLIAEFRASTDYLGLAGSTRRAYATYLKMIEARYGTMPIEALNDIRARGEFKAWRDGMAATPRKADYAWTTLAKVLAFAKDRGRIAINVCEKGGRLYASDRVDRIWSEAHLAKLFAVASPQMRHVVEMALWTGQRQGDLLALTWGAHDGAYVRLRQGKTGAQVTIPAGETLRRTLKALAEGQAAASAARQAAGQSDVAALTILSTSRGTPWTSDGFRTSWGKLIAKAGLADADLHFHDLRGTAVTRLAIAGCTEAEIATITGHSLETVRSILDKHYLSRDVRLAENAIAKLEKNEARSKIAKRLQNETK